MSNKFKILSDHIEVLSKSNNTYTIYKNYCSCTGFSFHHTCSHYKEAEDLGLIDALKERTTKISFRSEYLIYMRREALKVFLKKHNIEYTEALINNLEPKITRDTKPAEVLGWI